MSNLVLRELLPEDEAAFKEAVRAFAAESDWDFAFRFDEHADFGEYVARLEREKRGVGVPEGMVPSTYLVAVVGDEIVGRISLRHELNDFLRERAGHVGYGVVPSRRRNGYASKMLRLTLPIARAVGIESLLVTCDDDNLPSIRVVENCGGILQDVRKLDGMTVPKRRYWLSTEPAERLQT